MESVVIYTTGGQMRIRDFRLQPVKPPKSRHSTPPREITNAVNQKFLHFMESEIYRLTVVKLSTVVRDFESQTGLKIHTGTKGTTIKYLTRAGLCSAGGGCYTFNPDFRANIHGPKAEYPVIRAMHPESEAILRVLNEGHSSLTVSQISRRSKVKGWTVGRVLREFERAKLVTSYSRGVGANELWYELTPHGKWAYVAY
jgi:hypothetical protein